MTGGFSVERCMKDKGYSKVLPKEGKEVVECMISHGYEWKEIKNENIDK